MNVLVLGATGLIGNAVVRELLARGHTVTATGRRPGPTVNLTGLDVRYRAGDVDRPGQLDEWFAGQDAIVDAAAPYALHLARRADGGAQQRSDAVARRTDAMLSAVHRHGPKLVYISTLTSESPSRSVLPQSIQKRLMREVHPYFRLKRRIENHMLDAASQGLPVTVVRPSACVGPWDVKPRGQCWVPALLNGEISITVQHRVNVIDTRDVARGIAALVEHAHAEKPISLIGHNTSVKALFADFCEIGRAQRPRWQIPAALTVLPSLWAELAWASIGRESPLPSIVPMLICEQQWRKPSVEQQQLGAAPRPLQETARDTIAWYRRLGYC